VDSFDLKKLNTQAAFSSCPTLVAISASLTLGTKKGGERNTKEISRAEMWRKELVELTVGATHPPTLSWYLNCAARIIVFIHSTCDRKHVITQDKRGG